MEQALDRAMRLARLRASRPPSPWSPAHAVAVLRHLAAREAECAEQGRAEAAAVLRDERHRAAMACAWRPGAALLPEVGVALADLRAQMRDVFRSGGGQGFAAECLAAALTVNKGASAPSVLKVG